MKRRRARADVFGVAEHHSQDEMFSAIRSSAAFWTAECSLHGTQPTGVYVERATRCEVLAPLTHSALLRTRHQC